MNIEKDWKLIGTDATYSERLLMDFAEDINEFGDKNSIRKYYIEKAGEIQIDIFNHIVTLLTMCVNKELRIALDNIEDNIQPEMFPQIISSIHKEISDAYKRANETIVAFDNIEKTEKLKFLEYLNTMVICLLSGMKYIYEKEKMESQNTRYRREERIRDNMANAFLRGELEAYTNAHKIEIPYMYVLAWDLQNVYHFWNEELAKYGDSSYYKNIKKRTSENLRHISGNLINILIYGVQCDETKEVYEPGNTCMCEFKRVYYTSLLPTMVIVNTTDKNRSDEERVVLKECPLLPINLKETDFYPTKTLEFMINFMVEENKTQDYLNSDIVYLKDNVVAICRKLSDWVEDVDFGFTTGQKKFVEEYLGSVRKCAKNVPRRNNKDARENYLENLARKITDRWVDENLRNEIVEDGNSETYIRYAYFSVLKLSRNWFAHGLIKKVSMPFTVFVFLISIRYLIDIDKLDVVRNREFMYMEVQLFKLLNKTSIKYNDSINLVELDEEYLKLQENVRSRAFKDGNCSWFTHFPPKRVENDSYACIQRCPHQVLTAAGHSKSAIRDTMSEDEIFLTFWLTIHMGNNNTLKKIENVLDSDLLEILGRTYEYQKKSSLLKEIEE